jgi:hypothetical protein
MTDTVTSQNIDFPTWGTLYKWLADANDDVNKIHDINDCFRHSVSEFHASSNCDVSRKPSPILTERGGGAAFPIA